MGMTDILALLGCVHILNGSGPRFKGPSYFFNLFFFQNPLSVFLYIPSFLLSLLQAFLSELKFLTTFLS
jgi:hypothetical protein